MKSLSEMALTARLVLMGDRHAFEQLVRKNQSAVRRFLLLQTGDSMLADDLAQDTFVKAYINIGQFKGSASFRSWLFRIAYNTLCDYRRRHRETCEIDKISQSSVSVDTGLSIDMEKAMQILKPIERTVVTLHIVEGEKTADISKIMNINEATVRSHVHRAKMKLAEYLKNNGYGKK